MTDTMRQPSPTTGTAAGTPDPGLIAGRPRSAWFHAVVLVLAFGADVGAFFQVIGSVMPGDYDVTLVIVVTGFAATVVYLAHVTGTLLRERADDPANRTVRFLWAIVPAWLLLGGLAFWARLGYEPTAPEEVSSNDIGGEAVTNLSSEPDPVLGAFLFAALYIGIGLVAALGAYFTHHPRYSRYAKAVRARSRIARRLAKRTAHREFATAEFEAWRAWAGRMDLVAEEHRFDRSRFGDELKSLARHRMAEASHDPAVTDALLRPGREIGTGPTRTNRN
jgi:hypothetical protein